MPARLESVDKNGMKNRQVNMKRLVLHRAIPGLASRRQALRHELLNVDYHLPP